MWLRRFWERDGFRFSFEELTSLIVFRAEVSPFELGLLLGVLGAGPPVWGFGGFVGLVLSFVGLGIFLL